jgi:hypothetical protein
MRQTTCIADEDFADLTETPDLIRLILVITPLNYQVTNLDQVISGHSRRMPVLDILPIC